MQLPMNINTAYSNTRITTQLNQVNPNYQIHWKIASGNGHVRYQKECHLKIMGNLHVWV